MAIIKVLGVMCLIASPATACENLHVTGMLYNKWLNIGTYSNGNTDPTANIGEDDLITTTNNFDFLGATGNVFTVADNGGLYFGDVTTVGSNGPPLDISGLSTIGTIANTGVLAPAWYAANPGEAEYEWRVVLTSDQGVRSHSFHWSKLRKLHLYATDSGEAEYGWRVILTLDEGADNPTGDDIIIGDYWCQLETIQESIYSWREQYEFPVETVVVTWRFFDGTNEYLTQLVLVHTDAGNTYSIMHDSGTLVTPTLRWVGNGVYGSVANPEFATVCDAGNGIDLAGLANSFCGKKDGVLWSLNTGEGCTDPAICSSLNVNLEARNNNCNELIQPADSCQINGSCQYVTPPNNFRMSVAISKEVVDYATWAVLDTTTYTLNTLACTIPDVHVVDNGDTYIVQKEFWNAVPGTCGIGYDAGTGEYTIVLLNYDFNEAQTATTPTWRGFEIYKAGHRMYQIKCRPDDLPASLVQSVTIGNDIYETTADATSDRTLTLGFGTMLDGTNARFAAFANGDTVRLGTPLFPYVEFNPGSQYIQNLVPYAVYVKECWFGNAPDFSDKKRLVVHNRCPRINIGAFKLLDEVQGPALADLTFGYTMRVVGGPVRAVRWIDSTFIWLQCEVDFCTNTAFYTSSYCRNSCTGHGANAVGNRRRRDVEGNTSVILTTHITISDEIESVQESCVDSTMAIATLSALVVMLLVATVITVLLAVKLQNKKKT